MSKILGQGRDLLMAQTFGTGLEADALAAASLLPRLFFDAVFASAVTAGFIPVFNEVLERDGKEEAYRLSGSFFTVVGLATASLTVISIAFSSSLIALIANFDPQTAVLAARLLQIVFPSIFFTGLSFSMVGVLNSFGEFNIPAAMSIVSNGIMIVYYLFLASYFGVYGAALALLIGWVAQAAMLIPSLVKKGYRYYPRLWHPDLGKIFKLLPPAMVSTWIWPFNMWIISFWFASRFSGGTSSLNFANGLFLVIAGIFVLSVTNVIFPEMSRLSATGEHGALCDIVRETTRTLLFLLIPMTVGLMLLATPLVRLLYEHGGFTAESTRLTASALFYMALGMVGYGVQNVLFRAFYAKKRGKVLFLSGFLSITTTFTLCSLLIDRMGVAGLGLASAASLLVTLLVLVPAAYKMLGKRLATGDLVFALCKMTLAALMMGVVVFFVQENLAAVLTSDSLLMRLILVGIPAMIGVSVYLGLAFLLQLKEANVILELVKNRRTT